MSPQKPLEKASPMKEKEDIDALRRFQNEANFNNIAQSVPHAYKSYTNNLEKIHGSVNKVDAFTNDMYKAKEKLFEDQLSLANLQKLNRVNVRILFAIYYLYISSTIIFLFFSCKKL